MPSSESENDDESFASQKTVRETASDRDIAIYRQQRKTFRASATLESKKVNDFPEISRANAEQALVTVGKLKRIRTSLTAADHFLLFNGAFSDDDISKEVTRADEYQDAITSAIDILTSRLSTYRQIEALTLAQAHAAPPLAAGPPVPSPPMGMTKPKLQELHLTTFDGDPMHFLPFWEDFLSTVDARKDYSQSDKFKYLKEALRGRALDAVGGYTVTGANYDQVKIELKERFGNPEVAIFAHFQALLDLPIASNDLKQLTKVRDDCELHVRSLIALGLDEATFGRVFCPILLSKFPRPVKIELHRKNGVEVWTLETLRKLLKEEVMARERAERLSAEPNRDKNQNGNLKGKYHGTGSSLIANGKKHAKPRRPVRHQCVLCGDEHFEEKCAKYSTVRERRDRVIALQRCFVCLGVGHMKPGCAKLNTLYCVHCQKLGHNRAICNTLSSSDIRTSSSVNVGISASPNTGREFNRQCQLQLNPTSPSFVPTTTHVANSSGEPLATSRKGQAVMETCVAPVKGEQGELKVRFLFDTASTRSFIRTNVAQSIGAKLMGYEHTAIGRLGEAERTTVSYPVCSVYVCLPDGNRKHLLLSQIETISTPIRLYPVPATDASKLSCVFMAEGLVLRACDVQLDVLIGLDYYYEFVGPVIAHLHSGLVLKSTIIGHIVTGFLVEQWSNQSYGHTMLTVESTEPNYDLQRFWQLEELGIKDDPVKTDDDRALELFNKTIRFEDGRYQAKWLFREGMAPDCDNRKLCEGRLQSLHRRLNQQPDIRDKYDQTIQDQLSKGVIETAPAEPEGLVHYIPHHHVLKETSTTTKLRIVYDASAKTRKQDHSLNECLYRGPLILANLGGMLMRMRLSRVAMTADIEKAFLQIGLQREDRDATRFLWLRDKTKPPTKDNMVVYRFARVPFGFATSSFLLDGTIAHHLRLRGTALALEVLSNLFVDNVQGGRETVDDAVAFYREVKTLFSDASLNLREWYSNSREFTEQLPAEDKGEGTKARFLGLIWDTDKDVFTVTVGNGARTEDKTKRGVLKALASAFDPCGWFSPTICLGKMLMQDIWKAALEWDDQLPDSYILRWVAIQADLVRLSDQPISRYIGVSVCDTAQVNLHCFCDASASAYGAAVYITVNSEETTKSALLLSKSRVCPLKEVTMPRLELIAVTMGAKLVRYVRDELRISISRTYLWTDSKCVLWWLARDSVKERFVENRLLQIRGQDIEFRYVPTSQNPADIASRGATLDCLLVCKIWWSGPPWLQLTTDHWPENKIPPVDDIDVVAVATDKPPIPRVDELMDIKRIPTLIKLLRCTVYVIRFVKKMKREPVLTERIRALDLREATDFWVKRVQNCCFQDMPRKAKRDLFAQLGVYADTAGILRCHGRFERAQLPRAAQDPILLPKDHYFTRLVIEHAHLRVLHSGVKHTLAEVRQQYWVIHGRSQTRSVLHQCRICRRFQAAPFAAPRPPPLPDFRVTIQRPFSNIGLDYAGPVYIKAGETTTKAWICLFTCAAIRAIHLELVTTLATDAFLSALRRFAALRGKPDLIISDNGSQFRAADKFLRTLVRDDKIQDFSTKLGIEWKFIPEMSPWMGGMYERLVAPVKQALRKCVGHKLLDAPELQTVLYEIAAVINSRPLAVYDGDEVGEHPLTPNHFLLQGPWQQFADVSSGEDAAPRWAESVLLGWRRIQNVLNAFWFQWQREYLLSLREHFWQPTQQRVNALLPWEGQIVLISEKNVPRGVWRLARITKLIPSVDGLVRSAEVKFANGRTSRRAIKLLHPLESSAEPPTVVRRRQRDLIPRPPDSDEEYDAELLVSCLQEH